MERIELLINKLKEQFEQKADPAILQGTVQLLQQELLQYQATKKSTLGTSKVAVLMPAMNVSAADYERYSPQPEQEEEIEETVQVKETLLIDEGTLSVVQKNGQLDMVFDPMTEIPTLSHQVTAREVNEGIISAESLNDKLKQGKTELVEVLKESPVKDLRKAIGINDRYVFIKELFRGDEAMYERSIKTINSFNIYAEAEYWTNRELKVKLGWNNQSTHVRQFDQLVRRRFT